MSAYAEHDRPQSVRAGRPEKSPGPHHDRSRTRLAAVGLIHVVVTAVTGATLALAILRLFGDEGIACQQQR